MIILQLGTNIYFI